MPPTTQKSNTLKGEHLKRVIINLQDARRLIKRIKTFYGN